jgi:hypothetical protein
MGARPDECRMLLLICDEGEAYIGRTGSAELCRLDCTSYFRWWLGDVETCEELLSCEGICAKEQRHRLGTKCGRQV